MPFTIRPVTPDDAAGVIALLTTVTAEPVNNLGRDSSEPMFSEDWEREFLGEQARRDDWCGLAAIGADGAVVGLVTIDGKKRLAMRHCGDLGISVRADYRGLGAGRALMEAVLACARASGVITRVELVVLARNERAIRLYESLGFQIEGRHPHAFFRDGQYLDDLTMGLLL